VFILQAKKCTIIVAPTGLKQSGKIHAKQIYFGFQGQGLRY